MKPPKNLITRALRYPFLRLYHYVYLPFCFLAKIPTPKNKPDRTFLEHDIFTFINNLPRLKAILFAGVEIYTWHYYKLLPHKTVYTIDFNPKLAKYGTPHLHTVGSVCTLGDYYAPDSMDVIFYNGLIAFGLNKREDIIAAITAAHATLKPGGLFIIGWNNTPKHLNFNIEELDVLQQFTPYIPHEMGLKKYIYEASPVKKHTFMFLQKA